MNGVQAKHILLAVVVMVVTATAAVTTLVAIGRDPTTVVTLASAMVIPTITSLLLLLQVSRVQQTVNDTHQKVNGQMSALVEKIPPADRTAVADVIQTIDSNGG